MDAIVARLAVALAPLFAAMTKAVVDAVLARLPEIAAAIAAAKTTTMTVAPPPPELASSLQKQIDAAIHAGTVPRPDAVLRH